MAATEKSYKDHFDSTGKHNAMTNTEFTSIALYYQERLSLDAPATPEQIIEADRQTLREQLDSWTRRTLVITPVLDA